MRLPRHPFRAAGRRLATRQAEASLRFKASEKFGHELPDRRAFFRHAFHYLKFNGLSGDYAEFGSHGAFTFRMAFGASDLVGFDCHLWAFDSFEGLPGGGDTRDEHPQWVAGTMSTSEAEFHAQCRRANIPEHRYSAVAGYYSATLDPDTTDRRPESVSFAYVDCDLFSSTVEVLAFLEDRLVPGGIVAFDDYYCYSPDGPSGERQAARAHFAKSRWKLVPYIQYGWAGMSFVMEEQPEDAPPMAAW